MDNKARFNMEMGYLMVLHVRLGANFGNLHAKDSNAFCKRQIHKVARALVRRRRAQETASLPPYQKFYSGI